MNERPVLIKVSPKFKELLQLEAASNGKNIIKYTEILSIENSPLKQLAEDWKEKYGGRLHKKSDRLDMP